MAEREKYYIGLNGQTFEVSRELYEAYYKGRRKEKYFTHDLKQDHTKVDKKTGEMIVIPSREDSYERLLEAEKQFAEEAEDVEVQGNAAQFWAAEEPHEDADRQVTVGGESVEGNTVEVGGVTIIVGSVAGSQSTDAGTLAWQNSEGIYFRLHGTESMGTLLRVAASITEATEEQNTTDSFGG
mgnify:CR=1 FL=1